MLTLDLLRQLTQLSLLAHLAPGCIVTSAHRRLMLDEFVLGQSPTRRDNSAMADKRMTGTLIPALRAYVLLRTFREAVRE